jgi:hypothetical protein
MRSLNVLPSEAKQEWDQANHLYTGLRIIKDFKKTSHLFEVLYRTTKSHFRYKVRILARVALSAVVVLQVEMRKGRVVQTDLSRTYEVLGYDGSETLPPLHQSHSTMQDHYSQQSQIFISHHT